MLTLAYVQRESDVFAAVGLAERLQCAQQLEKTKKLSRLQKGA
jgi:hypothetical protein